MIIEQVAKELYERKSIAVDKLRLAMDDNESANQEIKHFFTHIRGVLPEYLGNVTETVHKKGRSLYFFPTEKHDKLLLVFNDTGDAGLSAIDGKVEGFFGFWNSLELEEIKEMVKKHM